MRIQVTLDYFNFDFHLFSHHIPDYEQEKSLKGKAMAASKSLLHEKSVQAFWGSKMIMDIYLQKHNPTDGHPSPLSYYFPADPLVLCLYFDTQSCHRTRSLFVKYEVMQKVMIIIIETEFSLKLKHYEWHKFQCIVDLIAGYVFYENYWLIHLSW